MCGSADDDQRIRYWKISLWKTLPLPRCRLSMQTRYKIQNTHVAVNDSLSYCCHDDLSQRKVVEALKLGANRNVSARQ